ncbi:hypothetical protein BDB00DRAFT_870749 [Zychaea mexicana]|uniref:uncharacterized protein n=1 Tax=Zychaea mexicana TaxID=64656 RepID=UPI0022FEF9DD|nr:uncharacterized protein BDB00DRAFT_870749 [Zychaea mexicana]KAI9495037.1 hypothetical protein BDB00DRAFT_870749 [Zychaea mexicana]
MTDECKCPECPNDVQKYYTADALRRHIWNLHTTRSWVTFNGESQLVEKIKPSNKQNEVFHCPVKECPKKYETLQYFAKHIVQHGREASAKDLSDSRQKREADEDLNSGPTMVDHDTSILIACDALESSKQCQQDKIMLSKIARCQPVVLTSDNEEYHCLASASTVARLVNSQPQALTFTALTKLAPSDCNSEIILNTATTTDGIMEHLVHNSPLNDTLSSKHFIEIDQELCN